MNTRSILAVAIVCGLAGLGQAADLPEGWLVLSEACSDGYYRDRVHSAGVNLQAIGKLREVAKSPRFRQQEAAEAILKLVAQKLVAEAEAALKVGALRSAEKNAQRRVVLQGLLNPNGADKTLERELFGPDGVGGALAPGESLLGGLAGAATQMAEARWNASIARAQVRAAWKEKVLPAFRNAYSTELNGPIVSAEIAGAGSSREVWTVLRNVSGRRLRNVAIVLKPADRDKSLAEQCYFIRDWPTDVVIRPNAFQRWLIPTGLPDEQPDSDLRATVELWCDLGHAKPVDAKSVGFYTIRDPFVETMIVPGMQYIYLDESVVRLLQFTRVDGPVGERTVEAKLIQAKLDDSAEKVELRYRGVWTPTRSSKADFDEVVRLELTLTQLDAQLVMPQLAERLTGGRPRYPTLTFRWDGPHYIIKADPGRECPVEPLPYKATVQPQPAEPPMTKETPKKTASSTTAGTQIGGTWVGTYRNSEGYGGETTLHLNETDNAFSGTWDDAEITAGKRINQYSIRLTAKSPGHIYQITATLTKDVLYLRYDATNGRNGKPYKGVGSLRRK